MKLTMKRPMTLLIVLMILLKSICVAIKAMFINNKMKYSASVKASLNITNSEAWKAKPRDLDFEIKTSRFFVKTVAGVIYLLFKFKLTKILKNFIKSLSVSVSTTHRHQFNESNQTRLCYFFSSSCRANDKNQL